MNEQNKNPQKVVEAIVDPSPLTIAQIVLLEKIESPFIYGDVKKTIENLKAVFLLSLPLKDALVKSSQKKEDLEAEATIWAQEMNVESYREILQKWLRSVEAFWAMLPRPEEDSKKVEGSASETVG